MNISVVQPYIFWEDKSNNFHKLEEMVSQVFNRTDIVILPEMFNTGFTMNTQKCAEPPSGETFEWMESISEKGNFGICGSYIIKIDDRLFNRWVFVSPETRSWHYDKRHLFTMGGENKYFSVGSERVVFSFRGVRISPYVCYDLRFPVWSRNRGDYDLMINSANWPGVRHEVWNILLKARAIENQCYVAGSNRIGTDGNGIDHLGGSAIISPRGEIIAEAGMNVEGVISAEISMTGLSDFRKKFPVLDDADSFDINS